MAALVGGDKPRQKEARRQDASGPENKEMWMRHASRIKNKYPDGWQPKNKLSRGAMNGIKELHDYDRVEFSVESLSRRFKRSPESIRRVLKSNWVPNQLRASEQNERAGRGVTNELNSSQSSRPPHATHASHTHPNRKSFSDNVNAIKQYLSKHPSKHSNSS